MGSPKKSPAAELDEDAWELGFLRLNWGHEHLDKIWDQEVYPALEFLPEVGEYLNEVGANLYHHFLVQTLRTARSSFSSSQLLVSSSPLQTSGTAIRSLLRQGLIATSKALYLLQPPTPLKRSRRAEQLYRSDRGSFEHAKALEARQLGLEEEESDATRPQGIRETEIIKNVVSAIERNHGPCGDPGCPYQDLDKISRLLIHLWSLYGSVVHCNLWHISIEIDETNSQHGQKFSELGSAFANLGWLYAHAVTSYLERYGLQDSVETMIIDWATDGTEQ